MRITTICLLLSLIIACNNPVKQDKFGSISIVLLKDTPALPDSIDVSLKTARTSTIDQLEVRVLKSDNTLVTFQVFNEDSGVFSGSITVKVQDNLKVLCIGTNKGVVERFGIDEDVDVKPDTQTDAEISGWLTKYIPKITDISPNPSPNGSFTVTWNTVQNAATYILQEADNPEFSGVATVYSGSAYTKDISGKEFNIHGMYYYRVQASNEYGISSGWSGLQPVNVEKQSYTLSGIITGADSVMVGMTGSEADGQMVATNGGSYSFTVLEGGTYFVRPQKSGYTFEPESHDFFSVASNQTQDFMATVATKITRTLTMAVNNQAWGATSPAVGNHQYIDGSVVTITATPAADYTFTGWTGTVANAFSATTTVTMSGDQAVTANFTSSGSGSTAVQMVSIPSGSFRMGDISGDGESNELPVHDVTISSFEMGLYEVTQEQYLSVMGSNPSWFSGTNLPVERVSWYEAVKFCNALSVEAGLTPCYDESSWACDFSADGFRLPTEAEWEYACRAGIETKYYTGNSDSDLGRAGWYFSNSSSKTHTVGQKAANVFGLYDMHGNVWEWCNDWYSDSYYSSPPSSDPTGPTSGSLGVIRGGSWNFDAGSCRSAIRGRDFPAVTYNYFGFRIVRGAHQAAPVQYTLTMAVNQSGWGTTNPASGSYTHNKDTVETITATPTVGCRFVNWTGSVANTSSATTTVTMNGDMTVTANFEIIPAQTSNIEMVSIPGGSFQMGSNSGASDQRPVHTVTLDYSFEMSMYEITQGQYTSVVGTNPSNSFGAGDYYPVYNVHWYMAVTFCNKLSDSAGLDKCYNESTGACDFTKNGYRLPTEAEWEYACRAGTTTAYYNGDSESDLARAGWYDGNSGNVAHPVCQKTPNAWGLYDMHGNEWEWCNDWYGSYSSESVTNPTGAQSGTSRVFRGGSWGNDGSSSRSASRNANSPYGGNVGIGFRVARGAFTPGDTKIEYFIYGNITGTDSVIVTLSGDADDSQVVTTDGGTYSFTVTEGGNYTVTPSKSGYTFTPATQTFSNVIRNQTLNFTATEISASGKIVFQSDRDGKNQLYTMDVDGSNQTRLTNTQYNDFTPSWSPDGARIVFASDRDGNFATSNEIYVMDADGSNQTRLTNNTANDYLPSWSPDGTRIVYVSTFQSTGGYLEVYVMDADGSNQRNLTNTQTDDFAPSWSSDSSQIVFESRRSGDFEIYIMNADGSNLTNMTNTAGLDRFPSWSPDGSQIAFYSERDGNPEIYVMDADGSNQIRLTNNSANDYGPSWSPDSSRIVFYSQRDGNAEIYVMDADGSNQTRITNNPAIDNDPSWSPF